MVNFFIQLFKKPAQTFLILFLALLPYQLNAETNQNTLNDKLIIGEKITRGGYIESENKSYRLTLEDNGDLVLSTMPEEKSLWSSETEDSSYLILESDGNLVLYSNSENIVWQSNTADSGADKFILQNNGKLVLYSGSKQVWSNELNMSKNIYKVYETIKVNYFKLPKNKYDWIGIYKKDDPDKDYIKYLYTNRAESGTMQFDNLPAGEYEARLFFDNSYNLESSVPFSVVALTMSETNYKVNETIEVNYGDLPGNKKDWIGVYEKDAPDKEYIKYYYTKGAVSGTMEFDGLAAGEYEARLFYDDSYKLVCKVSFSVNSLSMYKTTYEGNETIVVNYDVLSGNKLNWIGIYQKGTSDKDYIEKHYTQEAISGTIHFDGLHGGEYEARLFKDGSYELIDKISFSVNSLLSSKSSYSYYETITIDYKNLPGNKKDWIGIYKKDDPDKDYIKYYYTKGDVSGTMQFDGLADGEYEARLFYDDSYELIDKISFKVDEISENFLSSSKETYEVDETIVINYNNLPGNKKDWIGIYKKDDPDKDYIKYYYTKGDVSGTMQFDGLAEGEYEARLFYDNSYELKFTISFKVKD